MARDPVAVLLRLRLAAEDEAKRVFAARLAEEDAARLALAAAETDLAHEHAVATDLLQDDGAVEAYMAWLPIGRQRLRVARAHYDHAAANVTLARAALTLAHAAAEATQMIQDQHAEAEEAIAARKAQAALDEMGARPTAPLG